MSDLTSGKNESTSPENRSGVVSIASQQRYPINRGANKRSLSSFSDIKSGEVELANKYSRLSKKIMDKEDNDVLMDDIDDQYLDELPPSPSQPPANFSNSPSTFKFESRQQHGTKKLAIKNFRKRELPTVDWTLEWNRLEEAVSAIHTHQSIQHSLEELYKMVTNICFNEKSSQMYSKLLELSRLHLTSDLNKLVSHKDVPSIEFLRLAHELWDNFCNQTLMIRNIFLYLDRTYILARPEIMSLWDASLTIFTEVIINDRYVRERLVKDILAQISAERSGEKIDRNLIRSLLRMLTSLHIYEQVFEHSFLESTRELYSNEGVNLSRDLEITEYLHHVKRRVDEEYDRVQVCLDVSTKRALINVVEETLITAHMKSFVSRGLDSLIDLDRIEEITLLFTLLNRIGTEGILLLKTHFTEYIRKHGKVIIMDTARDKEMVQDLMTFKDKLDRITHDCFGNHEKMVQSLKDSFDYFVNTRPNKPAELIAKYVDSKLRSGNKESSDEELDHIMDKLITLFRFIHGKDVFEAFYKKDLAKRLLLSRSASVDAEKAMLSKLKHECGSGFTQKLEGMFKDMEISKDLSTNFFHYIENESTVSLPPKTEYTINVLTMGQWPNYEYAEATIPRDLCICLQAYQDFYVARHNGRKLQWQHSLGQCLVKGTFRPGCVKELQVSLFQTLVLLLFNEKPQWTFKEIEESTKIERKELIRNLQSLACAKLKILLKSPKGKDIDKDDVFKVNEELNEKLYRIRISQVQMKETEEEHVQTEEQINQDRQYQIDAAIVRIMKTRKTLSHQQLIQELFGQLRFPVNSADLKVRIASLMERDYLTRHSEDPNQYNYVS